MEDEEFSNMIAHVVLKFLFTDYVSDEKEEDSFGNEGTGLDSVPRWKEL